MRKVAALGSTLLAVCVGGATASGRALDPCPTVRTLDDHRASIEQVVAAARERIPHVYATVNYGQGRHPRVTRATSLIREVIWLSLPTKEGRRLRARAAKFCGNDVAFNYWAVVVEFPGAQTTDNQFAAFLAKTRSGWRLYGSVEQP